VKVNETHYIILFKVEELHITKIIIFVSRIKDVKIKSIKARYSLLFKKLRNREKTKKDFSFMLKL
jgi:hypothetical protein